MMKNNYTPNNIEYIKNYLLDYLYNKLEMNEYKYTIIKNIGDVYDLKNKKYYISANSCGINSFIVFLKKDNSYYSYWIDRRSISYNRQSLNKSNVRISEIKLAVDLKLYDGTILDGILIDNENNIVSNKNNSNNSNKMLFMITDIFSFCGKSLITQDYKIKMNIISIMFNKMIEVNNKQNNTELFISRPYEINQINTLFSDYIQDKHKLYNIKGIVFYPQFSGTKLIYIFDKQDEKTKLELLSGNSSFHNNINNIDIIDKSDDEYKDNNDKKKIFKFELTNPEYLDSIVLNLEMRKTNTPDVFKLFAIFENNSKNNICYVKKKIGYAYIPTYILSIKCKNYFINKNSIIMSCLFNTNKNKWEPLEEAKEKKIDIINKDDRIKITEQEIIEDNFDFDEV